MVLKNELKLWLEQNADKKFAMFSCSLIPNLTKPLIGVRLPLLRKKAKELSDVVGEIADDTVEEILLKAYAIGYINDIERQYKEIIEFIPLIDNWAVCDAFCSALKSAKKHKVLFWKLICKFIKSERDYEQRFACVMLLKYFCNEEYVERALDVLSVVKPKIWDSKQGLAWSVAEYFIKFPDVAEMYLKNFTPEVYKLIRRKILDSQRVSLSIKKRIKNENPVLLCG